MFGQLRASSSAPSPNLQRETWNPINPASEPLRKKLRTSLTQISSPPPRPPTVPPDSRDNGLTPPQPPQGQGDAQLRTSLSDQFDDPDIRLAIDLGTTMTAVTYQKRGTNKDHIRTVKRFPDDPWPSRNGTEVPTESLYLRSKLGSTSNHTPLLDKRFGYQVQRFYELPDTYEERCNYEIPTRVRRMKLLFYDNDDTRGYRKELLKVAETLKAKGHIKDIEDVMTDFLESIFGHSKKFLMEIAGLNDQSTVEITFTVPVCWSIKANASMTNCVISALRRTKLGVRDNSSVPNIFMVSEAEAAAIHALGSGLHDLLPEEVFLTIDCGGGTTDLGMFQVAKDTPLRLGKEVTRQTGTWTGSSDLNEEMRDFAYKHLPEYLRDPQSGNTLGYIIERDIVRPFEGEHKRCFRLDDKSQNFVFLVRGLRPSQTDTRHHKDMLVLTYDDMWKIFEPSLSKIGRLMEDQIYEALEKKTKINKVLLVGGFGDSPALQSYLERALYRINEEYGTMIQLIKAPPNEAATGVAAGAILRAQDKRCGPERKPGLSYGVLRHVEWDPDSDLGYMKQKKELSRFDHVYEIRNTLLWVIKAGQGQLQPVHSETFISVYCFEKNMKSWLAEEALYVSEVCHEDYYQRSHYKNRNKTALLGKIKFNLTHLKERIPLTVPEKGTSFYKVSVEIQMVVVDRNLKFHVHWPATEDGNVYEGKKVNMSEGTFSMVAAFEPGTA